MTEIHFHTVDDGHIAYAWSHGPVADPLVVLHGLGDSAITTYLPRFARSVLSDTPSLFVDLPGFGESTAESTYPGTIERYAEDVASLIEHLQIEPTAVFAHSMGANVALQLASTRPELVDRLILAEPLLHPDHSVMASSVARQSEHQFAARGFQLLTRATSLQGHRGDIAAAAFLPTLRKANPTIMYRAAESLLQERSPSFLAMIEKVHGRCGLIVGSRTTADLSLTELTNMPMIIVPHAGHYMMVERENETACAILEIRFMSL